MNRRTRKLATILIVVGILAVICAWTMGGSEHSSREICIDEPFNRVEIRDTEAKVRVLRSEDDTCVVQLEENGRGTYDVRVEGGTLRIDKKDKWYDYIHIFGLGFDGPELTLSLPEKAYDELNVRSTSGGVALDGVRAKEISAESTSGSVRAEYLQAETVALKSTSGSVRATELRAETLSMRSTSGGVRGETIDVKSLQARSTSGGIRLEGVSTVELTAENTSGSITLSELNASGAVHAKSVSGGIRLEDADAADFQLKCTSGSIKGNVRSGKQFDVHATSGSVNVPPSEANAGRFQAETTSGSIRISVE